MTEIVLFACSSMGLSGTTEIHVKKLDDGTFEARMGIALFGSTNMDDKGFEACNYDPFHDKFYDNYVRGKGKTQDEALDAMKEDQKQITESLWI